ncbi:hypothetical protein EMGBD3_02850 [Nitrosarchaeum sp.]|nr:hypothetical protein EMGBD3_02850 [Nitrosarchaeum sp.]
MMGKDYIKIGIMNGRLSPPVDNHIQSFPVNSWRNEFQRAYDCGFDSIEWVFDLNPNPIYKMTELRKLDLFQKNMTSK